jgi:hypothetical protein
MPCWRMSMRENRAFCEEDDGRLIESLQYDVLNYWYILQDD